ncbi:MAG: hypothetical protein R3E02_01860 [Blastomonas sp.]
MAERLANTLRRSAVEPGGIVSSNSSTSSNDRSGSDISPTFGTIWRSMICL